MALPPDWVAPRLDWTDRLRVRQQAREGRCAEFPPQLAGTRHNPATFERSNLQMSVMRSPNASQGSRPSYASPHALTNADILSRDPRRVKQRSSHETANWDQIWRGVRWVARHLTVSRLGLYLVGVVLAYQYLLGPVWNVLLARFQGGGQHGTSRPSRPDLLTFTREIHAASNNMPFPAPILPGWPEGIGPAQIQTSIARTVKRACEPVEEFNDWFVHVSFPELMAGHTGGNCNRFQLVMLSIVQEHEKLSSPLISLLHTIEEVRNATIMAKMSTVQSLAWANDLYEAQLNHPYSSANQTDLEKSQHIRAHARDWLRATDEYVQVWHSLMDVISHRLDRLEQCGEALHHALTSQSSHQTEAEKTSLLRPATPACNCTLPTDPLFEDICVGSNGFKDLWSSLQDQRKFVDYYYLLKGADKCEAA